VTVLNLPVLLVDDQPAVVQALRILCELHDIPCLFATSPDEAVQVASSETLGAVLQDMNFGRNETSGEEGVELFHALHKLQPGVPVLLMTAWASLETAVQLVKEGAADYLEKPWNDEKLVATLRNLIRLRTLELENLELKADRERSRVELATDHDLCGIVYESEIMQRVISLAVNVARSDAPVLITGPSGSGKERLAEIVQANSRRREGPFVRVNVGAIPEELAESELFGAEVGAYTGLQGRRIGHFETAAGGTLFLDEIDSLSPATQVKLLRVLQSGEFQRLGSSQTHRVDVRVISASNAVIEEAVTQGLLREDLLFRLNVVELSIPQLADRREDILPLAEHFLQQHSQREDGRGDLSLNDPARQALLSHSWPGNVRELENRIQRAVVVTADGDILADDLGFGLEITTGSPADLALLGEGDLQEREGLLAVLERADGVVAHAAAELGVSRQALYRKMSRLGVEIERRLKP
jgi:DNA-binding NtrC family response regulator